MNEKILIIEDDTALLEVTTYNLQAAGYTVVTAETGDGGLRAAKSELPDLILLDVMLPGLSGIEVCQRLRADAATKHLAIIMLTAKSEEADQLIGFTVGADDYVTKPFSVRILQERIRAILRRRHSHENAGVISCHGVTIDTVQHRATLDGVELDLTPSEFGLLETLISHPGRAFSRIQLIDEGLGGDALVLERTIDVHIRALRLKLGNSANLIETVRGVGYRFRRDDT
ncbi:MAG: response regulator [Planctomycetales bacterium]|nr:response regulator [Planctomycetales bacterium]